MVGTDTADNSATEAISVLPHLINVKWWKNARMHYLFRETLRRIVPSGPPFTTGLKCKRSKSLTITYLYLVGIKTATVKAR